MVINQECNVLAKFAVFRRSCDGFRSVIFTKWHNLYKKRQNLFCAFMLYNARVFRVTEKKNMINTSFDRSRTQIAFGEDIGAIYTRKNKTRLT